LREDSGAIWVIFGDAKFHVPDLQTLDRLYRGKPVRAVLSNSMNDIPNVPIDHTLLREENGAIWVVFGGAKFRVPDMQTLARFYSGMPVRQLWNGALDNIPMIPGDNTLFQEEPDPQVYVIHNGHKIPAQGNPTGPIVNLWQGALNQIPPGTP
jgi:hypothetical protein